MGSFIYSTFQFSYCLFHPFNEWKEAPGLVILIPFPVGIYMWYTVPTYYYGTGHVSGKKLTTQKGHSHPIRRFQKHSPKTRKGKKWKGIPYEYYTTWILDTTTRQEKRGEGLRTTGTGIQSAACIQLHPTFCALLTLPTRKLDLK